MDVSHDGHEESATKVTKITKKYLGLSFVTFVTFVAARFVPSWLPIYVRRASRLTSVATSSGSNGLATCAWKPAASVDKRSVGEA